MKKTFFYKNSLLVLILISTVVALALYVSENGFDFGLRESEKLPPSTEECFIEALDIVKENNQVIAMNAKFVESDESYFDDALFIGDSRTVGIEYYAGMDNADFFANVGMSIFNIWDTTVSVGDKGPQTIETLLDNYQYKKVYLMMGINELGGSLSTLENEYRNFVGMIHEKQPDAIVFICANLHVSKSRSDSDSRINNEAIDALNRRQMAIANNENIFFLDANEIFDDEDGALSEELTGDSTHLYANCYKDLKAWLLTKTVVEEVEKKSK